MAETMREKSSIPTTAGSPGGPQAPSTRPFFLCSYTGGSTVWLLGILSVSSVRMRRRTGFRAFPYTHVQRRQNSAPTQRLDPFAEQAPQWRGRAAPMRDKEIPS